MRVKVHFYALYKDKLGAIKTYELPDDAKVKDLLEILKDELGEIYEIAKPVVLIKGRYAEDDEPLTEEVDVIPPAAGGRPRAIVTSEEDIGLDSLIREVVYDDTGAVVSFIGLVKSKGGQVKELIYESHEALDKIIEQKIDEIKKKYDIHDARVVQFLGPRKVGQKTLIIIVSAKDRHNAFEAAKELLEKMKHEVPVWKLEKREDGEYWLIGEDKEVKRL